MQNLKRIWLVENRHEELNKFWRKHSKISKICTLMSCFWPKYIMLQLRMYRKVMFDGTQDWLEKFEGKLICCFKNDKNLVNFDPSTQKSQKFALWHVLSGNVWPKKVQQLSFMALESHAKFGGKLTFAFKNDMRNLKHFHQSTWKSQNWDVDGILLSKVENASA